MDYGFDFNQNICYITVNEDGTYKDLDAIECPDTYEERLEFIKAYHTEDVEHLVVVMEQITKEMLEEDHKADGILFLSREEAVANYLLAQEEEVWRQNSMVFEFHKDRFSFYEAKRKGRQLITSHEVVEIQDEMSEKEKDKFFNQQAAKHLNAGQAANVFLVGEEFSTDWMKLSLNSLCIGRRVFMGNHLIAQGALFSLEDMSDKRVEVITQQYYPYYWGIRAFHHGSKDVFIPILRPGEYWFTTQGAIEVYLDDCEELLLEGMNSFTREAVDIKIPLNRKIDWPKRTSRVYIGMRCTGEKTLEVQVYDKGFGISRQGAGLLYKEEFKLP